MQRFAQDFVDFLNEAVTAFHAVEAAKRRLLAAGFTQLSEKSAWNIVRGQKYFFSRNDTSLIAFSVGSQFSSQSGIFTVVGAHTDSPCLKIKPVTNLKKADALMVNTQPYGGGLWHTWFDRDLGIAGRVVLKGENDQIATRLVKINRPVARIPNLAIHLSRSDGDSFAPNLQEHAKAILSMDPSVVNLTPNESEKEVANRLHPALLRMVASELNVDSSAIEDLELQLTDAQPSTLGGGPGGDEMIYSGRLDNLCSSYQALRALIESTDASTEQSNVKMIMLFDHEEVGSASCQGAGSSMLIDTLRLINDALTDGSHASFMRALRNSFVVSIDMAHGLHPNYQAKHDATMAPKINEGLVIKHNANQRYATHAVSASLFRRIAKVAGVPIQEFTVRSDSACGSTIGPIIATLSGILTVDVGSPQYSMHSIRECMGAKDVHTGYLQLKATFEHHPRMSAAIDSIQL